MGDEHLKFEMHWLKLGSDLGGKTLFLSLYSLHGGWISSHSTLRSWLRPPSWARLLPQSPALDFAQTLCKQVPWLSAEAPSTPS
jgi:hypothetical protein